MNPTFSGQDYTNQAAPRYQASTAVNDANYQPSPAYCDQNPADAFFIHPISSFGHGLENYLDPKYVNDPSIFGPHLPCLTFPNPYGVWGGQYGGIEPAFVRKRNERERLRVKCVNEGYAKLRQHLPKHFAEKRLCKVETLRCAIEYISYLEQVLGLEPSKMPAKSQDRSRKTSSIAARFFDDQNFQLDVSRDVAATADDVSTQQQQQEGKRSHPLEEELEQEGPLMKKLRVETRIDPEISAIFEEDLSDFEFKKSLHDSSIDFSNQVQFPLQPWNESDQLSTSPFTATSRRKQNFPKSKFDLF